MIRKLPLFAALLLCAGIADARDTVLHLDVQPALDRAKAQGIIDGSVAFHFEGQSTASVLTELGPMTLNRKTNGAGKSDAESCEWAFFGALKAMQASAQQRGANAVIGLRSNYQKQEWISATQYECHAGTLMSGVALKGRYAKLASAP